MLPPKLRQKLPAHLGDAVVGIGVTLLLVQVVLFAGVFWIAPGPFNALWSEWLAVSWSNVIGGKVWTLVTYGALHDLNAPLHLFFNLLFIYFLGPPLEQRWGTRGFLHFGFVAVLMGGLFTVVAQLFGLFVGPTVGASAGTMGLLAAWSWLYPKRKILVMFIIPMEVRWALPAALLLDVVFAFSGSDTAVAAHFGGVAGAWLVLHGWTRPRLVRTRWLAWRAGRHRAKMRSRMHVIPGGKRKDDEDDGPMIH